MQGITYFTSLLIYAIFIAVLGQMYIDRKNTADTTIHNTDSFFTLTKDDKMFLRYGRIGYFKNKVPKKDSFEYLQLESLLRMSAKRTYKTVEIYYGAKAYYALMGLILGLAISVGPDLFNVAIDLLLLTLPKMSFPIIRYVSIVLLPIILYRYPDTQLSSEQKDKQKKLRKEIISLGILIQAMLATGNNVYTILTVIKEIKPMFREDIEKTLNEYYIDTSQAIKNLKKRINIVDFEMICDALLYAHESNNDYATVFLAEYLRRLEHSQKIAFEKESQLRPYFLLGSAVLPMVGAILIWFYPWLSEATKMLTSGFGI